MTVSVGVSLSLHPPKEQFELVRRVEALGFESVWCGDHVSFNLPLYESLTLLASYASITERIKLGSAVYLLALRPPAVAAKVTATLDALSGGRLIFGVGVSGSAPTNSAWMLGNTTGLPHLVMMTIIHRMGQRVVGVAQAKKSLSELLGLVAYRGESIVIEKRGRALARLVPIAPARQLSLARVRGWLDDDDPFFAAITAIVAARHTHRPRTEARRRRR